MKIEYLRELANNRTKGRWTHDWGNWNVEATDNFRATIVDNGNRGDSTAQCTCDNADGHHSFGNLSCPKRICSINMACPHDDMEFIAEMANHIDSLLDVVEAAKFIDANRFSWYMTRDDNALKEAWEELSGALEKLEKE